jgi:hypothetical protein
MPPDHVDEAISAGRVLAQPPEERGSRHLLPKVTEEPDRRRGGHSLEQ